MTLRRFAKLPLFRPVLERDTEELRQLPWTPDELKELREVDRERLLGLMVVTGIRIFNELPVIACDDEELRMAFFVWRLAQHVEERRKATKKLRGFFKRLQFLEDGVETWLDHII